MAQVRVTVDGVQYVDEVEPRMLWSTTCENGSGRPAPSSAATPATAAPAPSHLNGQSVKSCSVFAVQADGGEVTTIEGLARDGQLHPVQKAFNECHALQCGFCTPGMIMQAVDLLGDNPDPDEHEVREGIEGNLCRCTGYQNIVARRAERRAGDEARRDQLEPTETPAPVAAELTMTTTAEPTTAEFGRVPHPQGGRPPHHRAHPLDRQHRAARACCTWPWCARPSRTPGSPAIDTERGPRAARRHRRLHRRATSAPSEARLPCAWPITAGPEGARSARRSRSTRCTSPARRRGRRRPRRRPPPGTPASSSSSTTTTCRPCWTWRRRSPRAPPCCTPTSGTNASAHWVFDSGGGRHRRRARTAIAAAETDPDAIVVRRRFRQQRLIPAFMEPRSRGRRPDRRAVRRSGRRRRCPHIRASLHGAAHRHARAQAAGDRPGRRRRLRRQAAGDAGGDARAPRGAASSASRSSGPRPARSRCSRRTTAATRSRTSRSPPSATAPSSALRRRPARRHGRLPAAW